jgi:hypothetical protein
MQKCSYCGRENDAAAAVSCGECGSSLSEAYPQIPMVTSHRMMGEIQGWIWEHFAIKRRRVYLAGLLIGVFGALAGSLHHPEHGFHWWAVPFLGLVGVCAVWLLSFAERLQARIDQARGEGNSAFAQRTLFVVIGVIALVCVAVAVAAVGAVFI